MGLKLLESYNSEVDAIIAKGWLENEGVIVKLDSKDAIGTKSMRPNLWGLYLSEKDLKRAKHIVSRHHRMKKSYKHAIGSIAVLSMFLFLAGVAFILSKFI